MRSAVAFGVSEMAIVGTRKVNTFGNKNTNRFLRFSFYDSLAACRDALKARGFTIYGVEIHAESKDVRSHPFSGPAAFLMGNEGQGLNAKALAVVDQLVYIPQFGHGTASLNVSVAAAIVFHHFAAWAGYQEAARAGEKFVVDDTKKIGPAHPTFKRPKLAAATAEGADAPPLLAATPPADPAADAASTDAA